MGLLDISCKWNDTDVSCFFNVILRCICVVAACICNSFLFMADNVPMNGCAVCSLPQSTVGCLDCFYFGPIKNNCDLNISVQYF